MAKMLIVYYSRTKHTEHMAQAVAEGAKQVKGVTVDLRALDQAKPKEMLGFDAVVMGSPTYYGTMAADLKKFFDDSVAFHGQMAGKVGGAFASSANVGGGNETTVLDIVKAMLIHGMIVPGSASGDHYGPVAVGDLDGRSREQCLNLGKLVASLTVKLFG